MLLTLSDGFLGADWSKSRVRKKRWDIRVIPAFSLWLGDQTTVVPFVSTPSSQMSGVTGLWFKTLPLGVLAVVEQHGNVTM
jgi:hypothetical protein